MARGFAKAVGHRLHPLSNRCGASSCPARARATLYIELMKPSRILSSRTAASADPTDLLLIALDRALRAVLAPARASRPVPGQPSGAGHAELCETDRRRAAALMRVNHAGEVAAQALYQGQALTSRNPRVRELLLEAGREETDHLAWCETRLQELGDRPSALRPLWYAGSFAIGLVAGASGDARSLGFVAETERQVERHLDEHLEALPAADARSRAIVSAMRNDEIEHGRRAQLAGGATLPSPLRRLMRATAGIMTRTAHWI